MGQFFCPLLLLHGHRLDIRHGQTYASTCCPTCPLIYHCIPLLGGWLFIGLYIYINSIRKIIINILKVLSVPAQKICFNYFINNSNTFCYCFDRLGNLGERKNVAVSFVWLIICRKRRIGNG